MTLFEFAKENNPELLEQWHPEKNGSLTPRDVTYGSRKSVWWRCERGHEWQALIKARAFGTGCPICANRTLLSGVNDLSATHPELAAQWHPEKNGSLTPQDVVSGTGRIVWWLCDAGHEWQARINSRAMGNGCPVCAGKTILPGKNDLASHNAGLAREWHPDKNGSLTPDRVSVNSNRRVWWKCKLGHEWQAIIASRTTKESGCPFCTGKKVLPGFNDLETRYPAIAVEWHPSLNEDLTPDTVSPGSNKKVWWQCRDGHVWKARIDARTGTNKTGCPVCAGKVKQAKKLYYDELERELKVRKLDDFVRQALLDAIKLDLEGQDSAPYDSAPPSAHHQREMAEMLKDPNAWAAKHK